MTTAELIHCRLLNQQIAATRFEKPEDIVSWMVAMQAQEYAHAKWAIGLRLNGVGETAVEKAFNDGKILRTHLMRPTWHFVTPGDIRWMTALTAPRVNAANAYMYRKLELDDRTFKRCNAAIAAMLGGGKYLTRTELGAGLGRVRITASGLRLGYLLMRAELDGLVCSGPRVGKQFTYGLRDERAPMATVERFDREAALAEFTRRYFASRGPATIADCARWSGLTMKDVRAGVTFLPPAFAREVVNGDEHILLPVESRTLKSASLQKTFLLPDYDEYGMSYGDRSAMRDPERVPPKSDDAYSHWVVIDGTIGGTWKRSADGKTVEATPQIPMNRTKTKALADALRRYRVFAGL